MATIVEISQIGKMRIREDGTLIPRGKQEMLPTNHLPEGFSPHLAQEIKRAGGWEGPIGRQFIRHGKLEDQFFTGAESETDPLLEQTHMVAPRMIHKYKDRVLWELTLNCDSYCRHCFRFNMGTQGSLSIPEIQKGVEYIKQTNEVHEVIMSGGDIFTMPQEHLAYVVGEVARLKREGYISRVRMATRLPFHNPKRFEDWHYKLIEELDRPHVMVHINHFEELWHPDTREVYKRIAYAGGRLKSQSVFLRGVNADLKDGYGLGDQEPVTELIDVGDGSQREVLVSDNSIDEDKTVETIIKTFTAISEAGVDPYYMFQDDPVFWALHFRVPLSQAIRIWGRVRSSKHERSGIVLTARFVVDTPHGRGKIPVPEGESWDVNYNSGFTDYEGIGHDIFY